jgi:hypothetical protein
MHLPRLRRVVACAFATSLMLGATAYAAASTSTTITVAPRIEIAPPNDSPTTFPGVTNVREGERLPRGWTVVGRFVRITRGDEPAFAALRMTCPKGKTWRSGTASGDIGASVLDRRVRGKRSVLVMATFSTRDIAVGASAAGTVFALCR